jgi:hypothetical protein
MLLAPNGGSLFTPLPQTASETQAFNLAQLPTTQQGVSSLTDMYMNPFTSFLTDNINREAQGQYSAYKSALSNSGQMGSNREFLNAGEADRGRLNAIGSTLANAYQGAQQTGLAQNQINIGNLLGQGQQERAMDTATRQAPLSALQALVQLLQGYPATSEGTSKSNSQNGIFQSIGL